MYINTLKSSLGDIEYSIQGEGMPILFVHGGHSNCRDKLCLRGIDLKKFKIVTPSRPGYGDTPLTNNKTPRQSAKLFIELLNVLKLDKVLVYGVSAGGPSAIELAGRYPERVSALILASAVSKTWPDKSSALYRSARFVFNPWLEGLTWALVRVMSIVFPKRLAQSFFPQFSRRPIQVLDDEDIQLLMDALRSYRSGKGFLNDIRQPVDVAIAGDISCPTLIIHSENDNSVLPEHAYNSHQRIANARLEIVDNDWGHLLWLGRDSQVSIDKIVSFMAENITADRNNNASIKSEFTYNGW